MARVFISHASADLDHAVEVYDWLRQDGHDPFLDRDLSEGMEVGEDWKQRIYQELRHADAVVCMVSKAFVDSCVCSAEVGIADSMGCRLLPLHLEKNITYPLLGFLERAENEVDGTATRQRLLQALRSLDAGSRRHWREGHNPFPGLEPFTAEFSRVFFGRSQEIRELAARMRSVAGHGGLLAVVGPSGCGKSSLVRAGLLPLMETDPGWMTISAWLPGDDPLSTLAGAMTVTANQAGLGWSLTMVRERLDRDDGFRRLADELLLARPDPEGRRLLVTIDQAEELFTGTTQTGRVATLLREAMNGPVRVVATLRSEFLDDLRDLPTLAGVPIDPYLLGPLNRDMLRLVIEEPARIAGLPIAPELLARLISDTDCGEALPLLAFTLQQLASGLSRGEPLSADRYDKLGGVHGALTRHADTVLTTAVTRSGLTNQQILTGLVRLVTLDATGRRARRRVRHTTLPTSLQAAVDIFVEQRLLTATMDEHGRWIDIAHEALLTAWTPLDAIITERTVALHTARSVEQAATDWVNGGRAGHFLWDAERLTATLTSLGLPPIGTEAAIPHASIVDLDSDAHAFLTATHDRIQAVQHRERRRRTRIIGVLSALLVLALVATAVASIQWNTANNQRDTATARGLVIQAEVTRKNSPQLALQLGLAARSLYLSPETNTSLVNTLITSSYTKTLTGSSGAMSAVAFSPDGRTLATASTDKTVILWDTSDPTHPRQLGEPLTAHADPVNAVAFSPNGHTLATASADRTVTLWDTSDPAQVRRVGEPLTGHTSDVNAVAFSPDGRTLATAGTDKTTILWDTSDPTHTRQLGEPLTGHISDVNAVAFSPDGHTLATASTDKTVILWDTSDPTQPRQLGEPLTAHIDRVNAVAFSPDGRTLATGSADNVTILWDTSDPVRARKLGEPLIGHTNWVNSVEFSRNGRLLATASADRTVILWDISDPTHPRRLGDSLTGHTNFVNAVAFSPNGHTLATASADKTTILWDTRDPTRDRRSGEPLTGHTNLVNAVTFSPNGRTLATTSADKTTILWDTSNPAQPRRLGNPLTGHTGSVHAVAFSPNGRTLATASADRTVILWDTSDPAQVRRVGEPLTGHTSDVNAVAFSPNGHTLATTSTDKTTILWDTSNPAQPRRLGKPLTGHTSEVNAVAFSPNGHTLATTSTDHTVILWDTSNPTHPRQLGKPLTGHTGSVNAVTFSPNGHTLATGSTDKTTILWDTSDPAQPRRLGDPLAGHANGVQALAFSPDSRILATASRDNTGLLWDTSDPAQLRRLGDPLIGHTNWVNGVEFSPDGRTLVTASGDSTVILRNLAELYEALDHPVELACAQAGMGLSPTEWIRYTNGQEYQKTCPE